MRKKRIVVLLKALLMLVTSAAPALAMHTDHHPKRTQPTSSPGLAQNEQENRPAHAATPHHGSRQD
jgi:hypothetical protein